MLFAKRSLFTVAALLVSLACPVLSAAEDYELAFDRPFAVGDTLTIAGEAYISEEVQQREDGETTVENSTHAELNARGEVTILAVNDAGGATEIALRIVGDHDIEINDRAIAVPADARIIATCADGDTTFAYEGGDAIDGEFAELLDMFLDDLTDEDGNGGDTNEMLNLGGPRAVGDTWEMNHARMAADALEDGGIVIDPGDMESTVRFVEVVENSDFGEPIVVIELAMEIAAITFTDEQFPAWLEIKESFVEMSGEGRVPVEATSHKGLHTTEVEMAFLASGTVPGQDVRVEVEFEMERGTSLVYGEAR